MNLDKWLAYFKMHVLSTFSFFNIFSFNNLI